MADGKDAAVVSASSSITLTTRNDRSLLMCALQHAIRPIKGKLLSMPSDEAKPAPDSDVSASGSPRIKPSKSAARKLSYVEREVESVYIYDLSAKQAEGEKRKVRPNKRVYWFAGGGWQSSATGEHWSFLAELVAKLPEETALSLVSYPLAPGKTAPAALSTLLNMYRAELSAASARGERVVFGGDSAGGNVALCLALQGVGEDKTAGRETACPAAVVAVCPSTDLRRENPAMQAVAPKDPLLSLPFVRATADCWRGAWDAGDARISPVYADLKPLAERGVRVFGVTGGYDVLGPDGQAFRDKCAEAGVKGEWLHWDKQMHCWPLAFPYHLRESVEAKDWIVDVLSRA